jgi:hypothetical protein
MYPLALLLAAVAVLALRTKVLPRWLGYGATVTAAALAINAGFLHTTKVPAFLLFVVWTLAASVTLFVKAPSRPSTPPPARHPQPAENLHPRRGPHPRGSPVRRLSRGLLNAGRRPDTLAICGAASRLCRTPGSGRLRTPTPDGADLCIRRDCARLSGRWPTAQQSRLVLIDSCPRRIFQPVAQSPIKALVPENLGLLGGGNPRYRGRVPPGAVYYGSCRS